MCEVKLTVDLFCQRGRIRPPPLFFLEAIEGYVNPTFKKIFALLLCDFLVLKKFSKIKWFFEKCFELRVYIRIKRFGSKCIYVDTLV